ncbi:MAG: hypothetical protein HY577_00880 [Candidatus Nealsonbacteria bacterium]|nr:hypothetical protein [Candidatus Nealsonbacteria bacterium]
MNCEKKFTNLKTRFSSGQGMIEALLLLFGILFIFLVVFPQISTQTKKMLAKRQNPSGLVPTASTAAPTVPTENSPLCGEIVVVPAASGRAPFKVTLVGTGRETKYPLLGFRWDFTGDSVWDTEVTTQPQDYLFSSPGEYRLRMLVLDEKNNSRVCLKTISVTP